MKGTGLRMTNYGLFFDVGKTFHWETLPFKNQTVERLLFKLIGPIYIAHYLNINMVHIITRKVRPSKRPKVVKLLLLISKKSRSNWIELESFFNVKRITLLNIK